MATNSVNIGISIPMEMHQWLESKEGKRLVPNKSLVFQNGINKIRYPTPKKMHPMSILVIVMGMAFGVGCIAAAMTMFFSFMFTTVLFMLGATILLASLVTMIKEFRNKQKIKKHYQG